MTPRKRRQYGTGSVYRRASDGRWFGAYDVGFKKDGSRDRRTVSAKTEAEAKAKLKKKLRELDRGEGATSRTTVKAWAQRWLEETAKSVTPNAHTTDRAAVGWIVETIGARTLDQASPADFRAVGDAVVNSGRSTATAARYQGTLRRMLTAAKIEGYAIQAGVLLVSGRSPDVSDRSDMTIEEALACLEVASTLPHGSRWLAGFMLGGPRINEALGLTWPMVGDDAVSLAWQLQPLPYRIPRDRSSGFRVPDRYEKVQLENRMHLVRPKSKAGWRVVPVVPILGDALALWQQAAPASPHGLVWPRLDGGPADENADRDEWHAIQGTAGVGHRLGRPYHVHEIRHTAATMLAALGVDEATRIAIMGHSSIASTRAYEHRDLTLIRGALEKVAGRLALG
jgi:integrase